MLLRIIYRNRLVQLPDDAPEPIHELRECRRLYRKSCLLPTVVETALVGADGLAIQPIGVLGLSVALSTPVLVAIVCSRKSDGTWLGTGDAMRQVYIALCGILLAGCPEILALIDRAPMLLQTVEVLVHLLAETVRHRARVVRAEPTIRNLVVTAVSVLVLALVQAYPTAPLAVLIGSLPVPVLASVAEVIQTVGVREILRSLLLASLVTTPARVAVDLAGLGLELLAEVVRTGVLGAVLRSLVDGLLLLTEGCGADPRHDD